MTLPMRRLSFIPALILLLAGSVPSRAQGRDDPIRRARELILAGLVHGSETSLEARFLEHSAGLRFLRGRFFAPAATPEASARLFLRRNAAAFGLDPALADLRLSRVWTDKGGSVITFRQHREEIPLFEGWVQVAFDPAGRIVQVGSRYAPDLSKPGEPSIAPEGALRAAGNSIGGRFEAVREEPALFLVRGDKEHPGLHLAWLVEGFSRNPLGEWQIFVDAAGGEVVRSMNILKSAGPACSACDPSTDFSCANLFEANAVEHFDDPGLRDTDNVDGAQEGCQLLNLTSATNLDGTWANTSLTTGRAGPPYTYSRSGNESAADEMTAYYHADRAKRYLDSLGFPGVMAFSIDMDARDAGIGDQSFYNPNTKELHFGSGGVDDGQDPDIVYHEYGHAIQDNQVPGWGSTLEGGAMGEGFGDFWAASLQEALFPAALGPACVGDWDATAYNPFTGALGSGCLRRVDNTKVYPRDSVFQVHADGEIWSSALWSLRTALGSAVADSLVIKAHSLLTPSAEFIDAADALVSADLMLHGGVNRGSIDAAMAGRGIPRTATPASTAGMSGITPFVCETGHNYGSGEYKQCAFTQPGASRLRVHYSKLNTESDFDWVRVSDGLFNQVEQISGTPFGPNGDGFSAAVSGETIVVRFKADGSINRYGFSIDEVHYAPAAGRIPDGAALPGTPLTVEHAAGGDITLSWDASCGTGDTDFEIYEGSIGDFTSHVSKFCSTGGATSMTFTPAAESSYYLVVPANGTGEGSYGVDSSGIQRPPAAAACLPQELASTCL